MPRSKVDPGRPSAYKGAKKTRIAHESLRHGDRCPECLKGKLYAPHIEPATLVRVVGGAPLQATVYELEKLRCNLCGEGFSDHRPKAWDRRSMMRHPPAWSPC